MSDLWHHSTSKLYYGFLRCMGCTLRVVQLNSLGFALEDHYTILRVQHQYTLENHSTTITCMPYVVHGMGHNSRVIMHYMYMELVIVLL